MLSRRLAERHERLEDDRLRNEPDDLIANPAPEWVVDRTHARIAPRQRDHGARARNPEPLIPAQRESDVRRIVGIAQRGAEHHRILHCLCSALTGMRQHRMRRIAEQRDNAAPPGTDWIPFEQLVEPQIYRRYKLWIFGCTTGVMLLVLVGGTVSRHSKRWLDLGPSVPRVTLSGRAGTLIKENVDLFVRGAWVNDFGHSVRKTWNAERHAMWRVAAA